MMQLPLLLPFPKPGERKQVPKLVHDPWVTTNGLVKGCAHEG